MWRMGIHTKPPNAERGLPSSQTSSLDFKLIPRNGTPKGGRIGEMELKIVHDPKVPSGSKVKKPVSIPPRAIPPRGGCVWR
jgi:hypothetical protein